MSPDFAQVKGTRLRYQVQGQGRPLVLVHGFTLSLEMWDGQMEAFSRQYRVIRYDLRGFGGSDLPGEPYRHAEDLAALLDYLDIPNASLLGCSMGGGIAIDFALSFPERTQALILFDSALGGFPYSAEFTASTAALYALGKSSIEAARQLWLEHPMFGPVLESPAAPHFQRIMAAYSGWHWSNPDPTRRYETPAAKRLGEIKAPTLVIVGERDIPDMRAIAEALAAQIPTAHKVELPGLGHLANLEDPALFNQTVLEFLAKGAP